MFNINFYLPGFELCRAGVVNDPIELFVVFGRGGFIGVFSVMIFTSFNIFINLFLLLLLLLNFLLIFVVLNINII